MLLFGVRHREAVIESVDDAAKVVLVRDQRRCDKQRGPLTAGSDERARVQCSGGDSACQRFGFLAAPVTPVRTMNFYRPVQAPSINTSHARMRGSELG